MELPKSLETLPDEAKDAGNRLAARQFVKLTREPIQAFLERNLPKDDPSLRNKVAAFLETEIGEAIVKSLLSLGLSSLPVSMGEHPARLARELRVSAMEDVGDVLADLLMEPLRSVISDFVKGKDPLALPQESTMLVPVPNLQEVPQEEMQPISKKG